jgi:regulator of RNase E activity RraA
VDRQDLALGDDDGVLFVPASRAGEVLALAETIRDTERRQAESSAPVPPCAHKCSSTATLPSASGHLP